MTALPQLARDIVLLGQVLVEVALDPELCRAELALVGLLCHGHVFLLPMPSRVGQDREGLLAPDATDASVTRSTEVRPELI